MSARAYACPSCGAQVDEQARRCRYCQAPVATVRCASCFHMSVPDAGFCSGCGAELGLEPVGELGDLRCPICHEALDAYRDGPGALFDCGLCGGQFVEHARLEEVLERHGRPPFRQERAKLPGRPDPRSAYIPCPVCASFMNRKNFGGTSGVIVDVCRKHGTWFDLGELPRVLAFVATGGLERSRRRDAEERARVRHEVALTSGPLHAMGDPPTSFDTAASVARSLLDFLLS